MTHGSLFTGIGGFDLGFEHAGIETKWQVEIDPFCLAVLKTKWSDIPTYGDIKNCGKHNLQRVDIITGGFPCQDVSVAGRRAGLQAPRSGLFYECARVIDEMRPRWFVCENVPGLFSSNKGEDFRAVIETLADIGYCVAWRVLDSRYFGVAQRRRRVFIVGSLGNGSATEVLFERKGGGGDSTAGKETGERTSSASEISLASGRKNTGTIQANCGTKWWLGDQEAFTGDFFAIASPLGGSGRSGGFQPNAEQAAGGHLIPSAANSEQSIQQQRPCDGGGDAHSAGHECATPDANGMRDFAGLPEGLDSARYRALGNAVTTQVAEWIGRRILLCEDSR